MLTTVIADAYRENEKAKIVEALDMLCNANDVYGWASAGIYCFWDYHTRDVLYIGLAVDLTERFKQHNGFFLGIDLNTCKKQQINDYFKNNEKLGFSIVVQSSLSQPAIKSVERQFESLFAGNPTIKEIGRDGKDGIQRLEGILIEAYKRANGSLPKWNKIGGSIQGQLVASPANFKAFSILNATSPHYLLSRSTLREISHDPKLERYEKFLHSVRLLAPMLGFELAFEVLGSNDLLGTMDHILGEGYLDKLLVV